MGTECIDYAAILADLEAKKTALEQTIASFRAAMALGALGQATDGAGGVIASLTVPSISGNEVPTGAFLGKSIPDAAKFYLEIKKQKQTSRDIADGLLKGGMESTSKNFPAIVHAILDRARKAPNAAIVKVGTQWGLASWWPKGVFAASAPVRGAKKKHKKTRPNTTASEPMTVREKKDMPVGERIIQMLAGRPGTEFAHEHIADSLQANRQITQMVLAKLVKTGKIDTTASGKYRAVVAKQSAVS